MNHHGFYHLALMDFAPAAADNKVVVHEAEFVLAAWVCDLSSELETNVHLNTALFTSPDHHKIRLSRADEIKTTFVAATQHSMPIVIKLNLCACP